MRSNTHSAQLGVGRFAEQLGQQANRVRRVAAGGKMPKGFSRAGLEAALAGANHKSRNGGVIRGCEKERFVIFAAARQFGFARAQARVGDNLARGHMMETGYAHGTFLCNVVESGTHFLIGASERDREVASGAHNARNTYAEIAVRKINSPARFRDKGMVMPKLAAQRFDFRARAGGNQNEGDFPVFKFGECILCFRE